jgi:hypothetical protein
MLPKPLGLSTVAGVTVDPTAAFAQLQGGVVDQTPWRDEVSRPRVLFADRPAAPRAQETDAHPDAVRTRQRRFRPQGRPGLLPADVAVVHRRRARPVPAAVRPERDRLKARYDGFHYRDLARLLFLTCGQALDHKTVKTLWHASPVAVQGQLGLTDYHAQADRSHARRQVIRLYYQGGAKVSMRRVLQVSRPTVQAWSRRFEAEPFAGLVDRPRGPRHPRTVWLPLIVQVYP